MLKGDLQRRPRASACLSHSQEPVILLSGACTCSCSSGRRWVTFAAPCVPCAEGSQLWPDCHPKRGLSNMQHKVRALGGRCPGTLEFSIISTSWPFFCTSHIQIVVLFLHKSQIQTQIVVLEVGKDPGATPYLASIHTRSRK